MSRKRKISPGSWNEYLDSAKVQKSDLNEIIMDFLFAEGFQDVAIKFSNETGTKVGASLTELAARNEIRKCLHDGRIQEAIRRTNDLDPSILEADPDLFYALQLQVLLELIRDQRTGVALHFAQQDLAPLATRRQEYLGELEQAMTLLAFGTGLSDQSCLAMLDQSRRRSLATRLNEAILYSQGHKKQSTLSHLLRRLLWEQGELRHHATFPFVSPEELLSSGE